MQPSTSPVEINKFEIWCDKESDRILLNSFKDASDFLKRVNHIFTMPSNKTLQTDSRYAFIRPVIKYDRADFIVFYNRTPILMVEMTEHGYTGDNSLQRFARIANAGELGVPLLYYTPFSRTRVDEMEVSDRLTSKRKVSKNLFEGFKRIDEIHKIPIMAFDWPVSDKGMPQTLRENASAAAKTSVFGELLAAIEHFCVSHAIDITNKKDIHSCEIVQKKLGELDSTISKLSLRDSEVKINAIPPASLLDIIQEPSKLFQIIFNGEQYFFRGKDHKLVAFLALKKSKREKLQATDGSMVSGALSKDQIKNILPPEILNRNSVIYFCGYEKRSEPNGGIVVNIDYLMCRKGKTVKDRKSNLVVVWPRVFYDINSKVRALLNQDLELAVGGQKSDLLELIKQKCKLIDEPYLNHQYINCTKSSIGLWSEEDTIGRIYRSFCDILILNDTVLLGNHWLKQSKGDKNKQLSL